MKHLLFFSIVPMYIGCIFYIFSHSETITYQAKAFEPEEPIVVLIEDQTDWTPERIEKEIRHTFYEEPNTSVAIVKAEGGLVKEKQSDVYRNGVREPSFCAFQIHAPSWETTAVKLGYGDYRTNPEHCIAMARHIYDAAGQNFNDWSAFKNGSYRQYLP